MRSTLLLLFLIAPALLFGQSLAEVAKKEKERREKNKQEGKTVHVILESDITPAPEAEESGEEASEGGAPYGSSAAAASGGDEPDGSEEGSEEMGDVPDFIPPDRPLPEKLVMFEQMKRRYDSLVREIDQEIAKNEARLREIQAELGATSAAGGGGLPVAPATGTGTATRPMTGQESAVLVGEQNKLTAMNETLRRRKDELKLDLQEKGRVAGIPPGYLRF